MNMRNEKLKLQNLKKSLDNLVSDDLLDKNARVKIKT